MSHDMEFNALALDPLVGMDNPLTQFDDALGILEVLPGCYAFVDADTDEVIYVGKSGNVKERLRQHWFGNPEWLEGWLLAGGSPSCEGLVM